MEREDTMVDAREYAVLFPDGVLVDFIVAEHRIDRTFAHVPADGSALTLVIDRASARVVGVLLDCGVANA